MPSLCGSQVEVVTDAAEPGAIAVSRPAAAKHRVFLADDQEEVLRTVAATLENEFQIVGLAGNGRDVLKLVPTLHPEILVLDIVMPIVNGIETARQLKSSGFSTRVVFLTVHEDRDFLDAAVSAGAAAYVLKPHLFTDLAPAIRDVLEGRFFVSPCMQAADATPGTGLPVSNALTDTNLLQLTVQKT